jgi:predicted N-acyltransferase
MSLIIKDSIHHFDRQQWNALTENGNPFVSYEFFDALEKGKCIGSQSGWHPLYFTWHNEILSCALVVYIKTDSYGEFIFDWDWARAYQQYGMNYYPKLTVAIPYSPISAPKILGDLKVAKEQLLPALWEFYQKENVTGLHFLFTSPKEGELLDDLGLVERDSYQFHWYRKDEQNFNDYLKSLSKNRRKTIKRERRDLAAVENLSFKTLTGTNLSQDKLDFFYDCYLNTIDKKWSQAYLSKEFFRTFWNNKGERVYLIVAEEEGLPIACALYFASNTTLYGRYWGCQKDIPFLHFELCIYRGIELTLSLNLQKFEAGAQGDHKRIRGFKPIFTKSWHHLKNPSFHGAIKDFVEKERQAIRQWFAEDSD